MTHSVQPVVVVTAWGSEELALHALRMGVKDYVKKPFNLTELWDVIEGALERSINELDGVFTYLVATSDSLGMAKDVMAAKPMVLYESDDLIALASEEVAIRSIFPHEIDTSDPYEGEVRVWKS